MKKIIIINHYGVTPDLPGATRHYEISKYFSSKKEYQIEFWNCGYNHYTAEFHESLKKFKLQSKENTEGFTTVRIKSTPYRNSKIARQLNITIFDLFTSFKILFSRNISLVILSTPPVTFFTVLALRVRNIFLVSDVEDLWPLFLIDMGLKNKLVINYMEKASNFLFRTSSAISAVSKGMLNYVRNKIHRTEKLWLSPLGVNLEEYDYNNIEYASIHTKKWGKDFIIMYLGAHGRANDLSSVLKTIKEYNKLTGNYDNNIRNVSFVFIGDGDQKEQLILEKEELKLDNVYFENPVPGSEVPNYLMHADICLTNLQQIDSFKLVRPNKLFQYMALGKPIISGIWGESKDIIEIAKSGKYVNFASPVTAAKEINLILNNTEKLQQMGKNGRRYVEKYGDRKAIFSELYNNTVQLINDKK